jgi:hypothetical protein
VFSCIVAALATSENGGCVCGRKGAQKKRRGSNGTLL